MKSNVKRLPLAVALMAVAAVFLCSCGNKKKDAEPVEWKIETGAQRLSYVSDAGKTMKVEWQRNDVVDVWHTKRAAVIGRAYPTVTNSMRTLLSGVVSQGLAVGDTVELFLPTGNLDYTGQNGSTLNIYSRYSYAGGTFVVREVDEAARTVRACDSVMTLKQAVVALRLIDEAGLPIPVDTLVISASSGILVKGNMDSTPARYGELSVTNGNADKSSPMYVAIRNRQQDAPDTYSLLAKTRQGRYTASFRENLLYGRTYSKTITMYKK